MYDAIVVGARCAGAPTAMLLARHGARVLLVDRGTFPSDIPHGHFIHRDGPRRLKAWGLLDAVAARTPAVTSMVFDLGEHPLRIGDLVEDGVAWGYGPRRRTLDHILVEGAAAAGAELREAFIVDDYVISHGHVIGIRGRTRSGGVVEERARVTIGADGRHSRLARMVYAPIYREAAPVLCYYFGYFSGVTAEPFELYVRGGQRRVLFSFRTEQDHYAVFVGVPMQDMPAFRTDVEGSFFAALDLVPDFAARVRAGRREGRLCGATDLPNFFRRPYGPGWALVGDAGLHMDPYLALGISDAFRDAELLADAVHTGLTSRCSMHEALARYETRRNRAVTPDYDANLAAALFTPPPPEVRALCNALQDRPADATHFMKARMQMVDPATFFNPANLARVTGRAAHGPVGSR
jgi:flavin-dependent dehydrogenase